MTLNLDVLAGVAFLITAFCLASIFTFSSAKAPNFPNIPEYIRYGLGAWALAMAWRGANLLDLAQMSYVLPGRMNAEGAIASLLTCYMAIAVSFWFSRNYLRYRAWDSISHVLQAMRRKPELAPVAVDPVELAHAQGIYATAPGEPPTAAVREARRIPLKAN